MDNGLFAYPRAFTVIDTVIYAGGMSGVYQWINNGTNWSAVNNGLTNTDILSLGVSGTNLFAGALAPGQRAVFLYRLIKVQAGA